MGRASLLIATIALGTAGAQPAQTREVDAFMRQQMIARHVPGAAVAVVSHGTVVLLEGYGLADVEHRVPVSTHTVFEIASVTKQFTATAVMMLVRDGKITLDDTITKTLDSLPVAWGGVTIRHLLTHTSGIPDFARREFGMQRREDRNQRDVIGLVAHAPLDFRPGDRHLYSNTGYFLLGMVIEKVSGQRYDDFLRARIFAPLGMTDTRLNERGAVIPHRARGYTLVDYALRNAEYVSPTLPFAAGGLVSSAADMATWLQAQGSEKLLSREQWEEMWTPVRLNDGTASNYGFGWGIGNTWSRKRVEHAGGIEGFSTVVTRFIDDSIGVVFLSNVDGGHRTRMVLGILGAYLPFTRPVVPKPIADTDTAATGFLRRATLALARGAGDSSWYTPRVQRFYFPDRIRTRAAAFEPLGALRSFDLVAVNDDDGRQKRTYRAVFGMTPMRMSFWLTPDRRIDGVDFDPE